MSIVELKNQLDAQFGAISAPYTGTDIRQRMADAIHAGVAHPVSLSVTHGVMASITSPGGTVRGFTPIDAYDGSGNPLGIASCQVNRTGGGSGAIIGATIKFAHTDELLSIRNGSAQSVASGDQTIVYTTEDARIGTGITYSGGVFTVASGGAYQVNVSYHYDDDGSAYTDVRTGISGNASGYWSIGYGAPAGSRVPQQLSHVLSLSASGTFSILTNHGGGGSRTIGNTSGDTRFQSRVTIARISADTAAAGTVRGIVWDG